MAKNIQSIRGVHDILPEQSTAWQQLENTFRTLLSSYGYQEIRMPILESTELFIRSIGEVTDIVEKEMYTFTDRNNSSLTLRPEGTAGCVRAGIQHGLFHNQQRRMWYSGPMFRREKPQKGRYRQFHQFGVETVGFAGADIDAELIALTARLWKILGLKNIRLELNSIGSPTSRQHYKTVLVDYFSAHSDQLDEDSKRRLQSNPMRILDSKNTTMKTLIANAPSILEYLDEDSVAHFEQLKQLLDSMNVAYTINPRLVRGLDYYSKTVFEWVTDELGSQGTVCGGGRYDALIKQLGGKETTACGFGLGIERLLGLMEVQGIQAIARKPDYYFVMVGEHAQQTGMPLAEVIREKLPDLQIICNCGGGSFKSQIKRADKSGAEYALIMGDDEASNNTIAIKPLRKREEQTTLNQSELVAHIINT